MPTSKGKERGMGREGGRGAGEGDGVEKGGDGRGKEGRVRGVPPLLSLHFKHRGKTKQRQKTDIGK